MEGPFTIDIEEFNGDEKPFPVCYWAPAEFIPTDSKEIVIRRSYDSWNGYSLWVGYKTYEARKSERPEEKDRLQVDIKSIPWGERTVARKLIQKQLSKNNKPHSYRWFPNKLTEYRILWAHPEED